MLLALIVATLAAVAGTWLVWQVAPTTPAFIGLIIGLVVLVLVLVLIAHRFAWIMPWYYLLPAILFLTTFTLMPIGLTVFLAFTDYAGSRNGRLNPTTEVTIAAAEETRLEVDNIQALNCAALYRGCVGVRARVYASGSLEVTGVSLEGNVLTIGQAIPEGREVSTVEITAQGFPIQVSVQETRGNELILANVPPILANAAAETINFQGIRVGIERTSIERRMVAVEGDTVTLDASLPEGLNYDSIARYNDFSVVGLNNFRAILRQANRSLLPVFTWNVSFAVLTVLINAIVGVFLAVLLNNPELRFRNLYRTLLIIPWALPAIITIQVWRGFLNLNFGAINRLLALFDLPVFNWLGDPFAAKAAVLMVNLWLGFPFMMTATLGALSAIPKELYEAAKIDGASAWQTFWGVTAPLLRTALVPITLTGFAFNFNNFNVIFLLTDGGPALAGGISTARATDILISWAYNEAFRSQGGFAYGLGSAISILIFMITLAVSLVNFRVTGALKEDANT